MKKIYGSLGISWSKFQSNLGTGSFIARTKQLLKVLVCYLLFTTPYAYADVEPPDIGFFSFPTSQMPGPFYSFGQNIVDKGEAQLFGEIDYLYSSTHMNELIGAPSFIYGMSDVSSIMLLAPYSFRGVEGHFHSSGLGDTIVQGEYAYYNYSDINHYSTGTILANITLPTGSATKVPQTGYGSPSLFLGTTYNQTYVNWFWFVSPAVTWVTPRDQTHFGNLYYYQGGVGRNLVTVEKKYIFSALLEVDGEYDAKDKIDGMYDPDSGGNIIWLTPSLWFSTMNLTIQLGVSFPISQEWNGNQPNFSYLSAISVGWSFF